MNVISIGKAYGCDDVLSESSSVSAARREARRKILHWNESGWAGVHKTDKMNINHLVLGGAQESRPSEIECDAWHCIEIARKKNEENCHRVKLSINRNSNSLVDCFRSHSNLVQSQFHAKRNTKRIAHSHNRNAHAQFSWPHCLSINQRRHHVTSYILIIIVVILIYRAEAAPTVAIICTSSLRSLFFPSSSIALFCFVLFFLFLLWLRTRLPIISVAFINTIYSYTLRAHTVFDVRTHKRGE